MKKDAHKWLLRFLLAYVPTQNVVYIFILACSTDIYSVLTSWMYIYYLVSLPLIFSLGEIIIPIYGVHPLDRFIIQFLVTLADIFGKVAQYTL